jgi:CDP-paratose 2-epimerase
VRILISGICGFAGNAIAQALVGRGRRFKVAGFDNFIRPGSEANRGQLKRLGIRVVHSDVRSASDLESLPACDWVIDAAANPNVMAGVDGRSSSRQLVEHNLGGTANLLELCKRNGAGFTLLSTSRVYSIRPLAGLALKTRDRAFQPRSRGLPPGIGPDGITETFATGAPVSLYGATKLASEALALEYGETFGFPVFINRCGILAGAGQFGRPDQGIFSFWINSHLRRQPLKYIGFGAKGYQVRDCLHPADLVALLEAQFSAPRMASEDRLANVGGGMASALSLRQLTDWCDERFGRHPVTAEAVDRPFDIPWLVLDPGKARRLWSWRPRIKVRSILEEIAAHAEAHPEWLELSAPLG